MRCAIIEAETRDEVMKEMEERMHSIEKMYARRLMSEVTPSLHSEFFGSCLIISRLSETR